MRLSFVAKLVIFDNSFFHPAGERRGPVFKAELATGSDRQFGLGGGFGLEPGPGDIERLVSRSLDRRRRVGLERPAGDQPVEAPADGRQVLLDGWAG